MMVHPSLRSFGAVRFVTAAIAFSAALLAAHAAREIASREIGLPHFDAFNPRDYQGHTQVWSAAQDAAGVLYFGNYGRVLSFDGARWTHIDVPNTSFVRALTIDANDTLWIGGVDQLGFARTDATGRRVFVSLKEKLPDDAQRCGELWRVHATPRGALFQSNSWLLRWDGDKFATLALAGPGAWQVIAVGAELWATHAQRGWFRVEDDGVALTLTPLVQPTEIPTTLIFALRGASDGEFILGTGRLGLFRYADGKFSAFTTEADDVLKQQRLYRGTRLADGRLAFATLQGGAVLLDAHGRLLARLNEEAGTPDNTCINVFADAHEQLWLCLEKGVVRVDTRPWLSWFGPANGSPRGTLGTPVRFRGELHVPTSSGLHRLAAGAPGVAPRLAPVPEFRDYLSSLALIGDRLIASGEQGLIEWDGQRPRQWPGDTMNAFSFGPSRSQPGRWLALVDGALRTYRRDDDTWIDEGRVPALPFVRSLAEESDGTFWFGTPSEGVLRVRFPEANVTSLGTPEIKRYGVTDGLPAGHGWARVTMVGNRPLLTCEKGFYRYDAAADRFSATTEFGVQFADGTMTARTFAPDRDGGLWIVARPAGQAELVTTLQIGLADARGWHVLRLPQLQHLDDVQALHLETDTDVLWIAGHGGLLRIDLAAWRTAPPPGRPVVQLRRATTDDDRALPLAANWQLPFASRLLRVDFAAPALAGDRGAEFETTLAGDSSPVVQTNSSPEREFAALSPGHYTLGVRARGTGGEWSAPVQIAFTVLPPWWRSGWAWTTYALAAGVGVFGLVRYRTASLHRRAEKLEAAIAARTEELRKSNAELARLHRLELDEKIAARLAEEKARLEVLRYQLNPHFLFNALTSVCAQLPPALSGARATIERLTDFCQATLFRDEQNEHPLLADEVRLLTAYLEIEKVRWGDALSVEVDIDPATARARVPSLLLLPLVENALKYGRATTRGALGIRLGCALADDGGLEIEIANTGAWVASRTRGDVPSLGIGLENLKQRLQRYYPGTHELATASADGWVIVRLRLQQLAPQSGAAILQT